MPRVKSGGVPAGKTPAAELSKQINRLGLSQAQVAKDVGLSVMTLKKILEGGAKVDIERALIFAKYFGTKADFWIDLQRKAGLAEAKKDAKLQKQLKELKKAKPVKEEKKAGVAAKGKRGPKPKKGPFVKKAAAKKRGPRKASAASGAPSTSISF